MSFLSDLCFNQNKNKLCSLHSPDFFKILKEPTLLQKQTILHIKALLFSFLEPEEQGCDLIMGGPRPHPVSFLYFFFLRSWGVSSVPFPFRFPFQLHCELVSSLLALDATELVSQPLTQTVVEMINIHVISVQQKR